MITIADYFLAIGCALEGHDLFEDDLSATFSMFLNRFQIHHHFEWIVETGARWARHDG